MPNADVLIIGAGIIGSSVAFHLLERRPELRVAILEQGSMAGMGATAKATGGIRHQFDSEVNIRLTQLSVDEYEHFKELTGHGINLRKHGYLFVTASRAQYADLERSVHLQRRLGVSTHLLSPSEVKACFPEVRVDDLIGGTYCADDGSADPYQALSGYLARATDRGLALHADCQVEAILSAAGHVTGVRLVDGRQWSAPAIVLAAGAHAHVIAGTAGIDVPVRPYRRQVFVARPIESMGGHVPLTVDLDSGWYLHKDGNANLLFGGTDNMAYPGFNLAVDWAGADKVFRAASRRIPLLDEAQIVRGYAGLRSMTPDFHAVIGACSVEGLFLGCGFSGHGFMHAPAIGRLLAEYIIDGNAVSIDATCLELGRFSQAVENVTRTVF